MLTFPGNGDLMGTRTADITVQVAPTISATLAPTAIRLGQVTKFSGYVAPAHAGKIGLPAAVREQGLEVDRLGEAEYLGCVRLRHQAGHPRPDRLPGLVPGRRRPRPGVHREQDPHGQLISRPTTLALFPWRPSPKQASIPPSGPERRRHPPPSRPPSAGAPLYWVLTHRRIKQESARALMARALAHRCRRACVDGAVW